LTKGGNQGAMAETENPCLSVNAEEGGQKKKRRSLLGDVNGRKGKKCPKHPPLELKKGEGNSQGGMNDARLTNASMRMRLLGRFTIRDIDMPGGDFELN